MTRPEDRLNATLDHLAETQALLDEDRAALAAVVALHRPVDTSPAYCMTCHTPYPCATAEAAQPERK